MQDRLLERTQVQTPSPCPLGSWNLNPALSRVRSATHGVRHLVGPYGVVSAQGRGRLRPGSPSERGVFMNERTHAVYDPRCPADWTPELVFSNEGTS